MNYEQFTHTLHDTSKKIFLVDMRKEIHHHFSELVREGIAKYIKQNKNIVILVNKKGFSSGIICRQCGHIPECNNCSVNISYHEDIHKTMFGLCHICKTQYNIPTTCPKCGSSQMKPYGLGIQQVATWIKDEYGITPIVIDSNTTNSPNKITKLTASIAQHTAPKNKTCTIVLGTSLLTTPIKNHPVDLVIFLHADIGLNIPDYTAAEKNFNFLYEAFAQYPHSHFIVQSFNPEHYSIRAACKMDPVLFSTQDGAYRKQYHYPPYQDLCVLLYKHDIEAKLHSHVDKLYKEILYYKEKYALNNLEIYTTPPLIYKKFGTYRYNIILKGEQLRNFMDIIYSKCSLHKKGFKVDRQADSIV